MNDITSMPQLSPSSLTSSVPTVSSSSLPSPEDDPSLPVEANSKFPPGDTPSISLPTSCPPTENTLAVHVNTLTPHPLQQSQHRFHPYTSSTKTSTIRDLHIASRLLGLSSQSDINLAEDLQRGKAYYLSALSGIPHCVLKNAYECKLADHECYTYRIALSMAEIKSSKQRQSLLKSIRECHKRDAGANEEQIMILESLLGMKRITTNDLIEDEDLQSADQKDGLAELGVVDKEVNYLEEAIQVQSIRWRKYSLSSEDGDSSDSDNADNLSDE